MKQLIVDLLATHLGPHLATDEITRLIEIPPSDSLGDFAFPCFPLAKVMRRSPLQIAADLREKLTGAAGIERVEAVSGYLNFFVDRPTLVKEVVEASRQEGFGRRGDGRRVVVEFASPNTNKPLHLGHLRNIAIGEGVARLLAFCGNTVTRTSINNDRGIHICKSMLAYLKKGNGITPQGAGKKSDHLVGDFYVLFSRESAADNSLNEEAQDLLRKWEAGDEETVALWKTMNRWALDGFGETFRLFGIAFDKQYFESDIYKSGKEIVLDGLKRGIFRTREDGAVVADLNEDGGGEKVLLRPDGTSVYIVQDLYLALLKEKEFSCDLSVYVVGNEQDHHFIMLKELLLKLGYAQGEKIKHLSYGMVELPEGKMKSREGTVVDADDLIGETQELAKTELAGRYTLTPEEAKERSLRIALAAIKYQVLKVDIAKNMVFDPKKAISFEGDTGPYLLYSYARSASILRKAGAVPSGEALPPFCDSEVRLVKRIGAFPDTVASAAARLSPSLIACYAFDLAQCFNEFYHACQVIGSGERESFRLALVQSFRSTLRQCLWLLGIEEIEEM